MKELIRTLVAHYPDQFNKAMDNPKLEGWFVGKLMSQLGGKMNPKEISTEVSDYFIKMRRGYDAMDWNVEKSGKDDYPQTLGGFDDYVNKDVKRNKQVDVPTEAWQKRIERDINEIRTTILNEVTRTEKTEETLIILVAYLSSVGLLDMNDWNKYLQISRK